MAALKVTILVTERVARALHHLAPASDESRQLLQTADGLGLALEPLHPGIDDASLSPYFTVDIPDMAAAERVMAKLRPLPAVEAAYAKPPDEPP